jgi:hypothetical protein
MVATEHPIWCDPTFCDAPAELPAMGGGRYPFTAHHSIPVQIGVSVFDVFTGGKIQGPLLNADGGTFAWLTQAVAPWKCTTYLNIGLYQPNVGCPESLLHVPMAPRNTIAPSLPMAAGERLWHLCTHALEVRNDEMFRYGQYGEVPIGEIDT